MTTSIRLTSAVSFVLIPTILAAAEPGAGPDPNEVRASIARAADFLKARQAANGSFSAQRAGPGISALVAAGLIRASRGDDPLVQQTLKYLESAVKPDGGIYDRGLANYTTSVALMAFKEANAGGKYDAVIANGAKFLKTLQFDESTSDSKDVRFGGVGYGGRERPDLSNTHYFLDALEAAGMAKTDPPVQRALVFLGRCQNLPGESNDQPFAKKTTPEDKGGFVYTPTEPRDDDPRRTPAGGLRSEGALTYAGLKSYLYAGLSSDDPRVKAAVEWIGKNYTLDANPGAGTAGLYYYYHLFAKTMNALGDDVFVDAKGIKHDWRAELFATLKKRQRADGSWANDNAAFLENNPDLATAFAILSLSYCAPPRK